MPKASGRLGVAHTPRQESPTRPDVSRVISMGPVYA